MQKSRSMARTFPSHPWPRTAARSQPFSCPFLPSPSLVCVLEGGRVSGSQGPRPLGGGVPPEHGHPGTSWALGRRLCARLPPVSPGGTRGLTLRGEAFFWAGSPQRPPFSSLAQSVFNDLDSVTRPGCSPEAHPDCPVCSFPAVPTGPAGCGRTPPACTGLEGSEVGGPRGVGILATWVRGHLFTLPLEETAALVGEGCFGTVLWPLSVRPLGQSCLETL